MCRRLHVLTAMVEQLGRGLLGLQHAQSSSLPVTFRSFLRLAFRSLAVASNPSPNPDDCLLCKMVNHPSQDGCISKP